MAGAYKYRPQYTQNTLGAAPGGEPAREETKMHQEFEVHLLNDEGIAKAKRLAELFDHLLTEVETLCLVSGQGAGPNARQLAIVRTKLEEASFFSKKAMAILPENQR